MNAKRLAAAAMVAAASLLLAACTATPPQTVPTSSGEAPPQFTGAFANEYLQAWNESDNDFVRDIIRDEQITEQEWAEVTAHLTDCLAQSGIEFEGFDPQGGYSANVGEMDGARANELMGACESESGEAWVGWLRTSAVINPENRDIFEITAECLVREGAVAPGYTADDYKEDVPTMTFPYLDPQTGPAIFAQCGNDPLSLLPDE